MTVRVRTARRPDAAGLGGAAEYHYRGLWNHSHGEPLADDILDDWFLSGPEVLFCLVAELKVTGTLLGFQSVYRDEDLPPDWGDIATFTSTRPKVPGVGARPFERTRALLAHTGLSSGREPIGKYGAPLIVLPPYSAGPQTELRWPSQSSRLFWRK
tara:strand:+ start:68812 stop:69279 length:468 start_codon:yes stop_codon:yes gene_type:complete